MIALLAAALLAQAQPVVEPAVAEGGRARACMVQAFAGADLAAIREAARSGTGDGGRARLAAILDGCAAPLGEARAQKLRDYFAAEMDRRTVLAFLRVRLGDAAMSRFEGTQFGYNDPDNESDDAYRQRLAENLREIDIGPDYVGEAVAYLEASRRGGEARSAIEEARPADRALVVATMESSVELRANIIQRRWPYYYLLAGSLFAEGARDEAALWYFIAQLRGRTAIRCRRPPPGGDGALLGAMDATMVEEIIVGHAAADPARMTAAMTQALAWDAANADPFNTPEECAAARGEVRRALERDITYVTEHPEEFRALYAQHRAPSE